MPQGTLIVPMVRELNQSECAANPECDGTMPEAHLDPGIMFMNTSHPGVAAPPAFFEDAPLFFAGRSAHIEWGLDLIDQRTLRLDGRHKNFLKTGANTVIYSLDTGINCDQVPSFSACSHDAAADDYDNHQGCRCDNNGHGTAMAHVAGQLAEGATLVSVPVLNDAGNGNLTRLLFGLGRVLNVHTQNFSALPGVVLAPLSTGPMSLRQIEGVAALVDQAIQALKAVNVVTVVAAGNDNADTCYVAPARAKDAVTVAALERNGRRAAFSNWGTCADVFAPADSEALERVYAGTSVSAAYAAGVAATVASEANLMAWQVAEVLLTNASSFAIKRAWGVIERHVHAPRRHSLSRGNRRPAASEATWRHVTLATILVAVVLLSLDLTRKRIAKKPLSVQAHPGPRAFMGI